MRFGEMKTSLKNWAMERVREQILTDAINDAVVSLWDSIILIHVQAFLGGPATVSFASAAERATLISVTDPVGAPVTAAVAQAAALGARTYSVTFSLVTESGSETLESPATAQILATTDVCRVTSPAFVEGAIGYNVYSGAVAARRCRQNPAPIPFGVDYTETLEGWPDEPSKPSPPTENTTADDIFFINRLELATPNSTYNSFTQASFNSYLFERAQQLVATTSDFQFYAYDLVNQRTIEIRPATGKAISPRYFYVKRPRRIRYDNADLPFTSIPHEEFIRRYCLSNIYLALHEYSASEAWDRKASQSRSEILLALNMANSQKDATIARFM